MFHDQKYYPKETQNDSDGVVSRSGLYITADRQIITGQVMHDDVKTPTVIGCLHDPANVQH